MGNGRPLSYTLCLIHNSDLGTVDLERGATLRIGRHRENDLVIQDGGVSRFHARLIWRRDSGWPEIFDSGSENGTYVDGKRIGVCLGAAQCRCLGPACELRSAVLQHESRFAILDHVFQVEVPGYAPPALLEDSGDAVALFTEQRPSLTGDLAQTPAEAVLRQLESERRTGTLHLRLPAGEGKVTLCLGRIMSASSPDGRGRRALERILAARAGTFRFGRDLEPEEDPLQLWISDFLAQRDAPTTQRLTVQGVFRRGRPR